MDRRHLTRVALISLAGAALLVALGISAWRVRDRLWPERSAIQLDQTFHPGRFEERAPWANARALEVLEPLAPIVSEWDTTGTPGDRTFHVTLTSDIPLEEGNRRITDALVRAGVEILDVVELPARDKSRGLEIAFGLEQRQTGRMLVLGWRRSAGDDRPKVALVIDDLGYASLDRTEAFLTMGVPLTVTILPAQKHSARVAQRAAELGHQVLLHLPMEPIGYPTTNPGEGAILVDMSASEIRHLTERHLEDVPGAVGISNHMGSMATQDRPTMTAILELCGREGLYFLDSRTTPRSLVGRLAREMKTPCVRNDLFLDHERTVENVSARLNELVQLARDQGSAVGIFHPHEVCLETIPPEIERHRTEGVRFVSVLDLDQSRWLGALPPGHGLLAP